nr:isoprenyl transferase [Maliibacterium massiliense]
MKWFTRKKEQEVTLASLDAARMPRHVAVIMDGNGRWAQKRGMPRSAGHRAGVEALRRVIRFCGDAGVEVLSLYAFSTENWQRPADEVNTLMKLLIEYFNSEIDELDRNGARIVVMGRRDNIPEAVREAIARAERRTQGNGGIVVNIAFNYGAREEIVLACRALARQVAQGKIAPEDIDEARFAQHLYSAGLPDPDLIVRTSGEQRLSNFLLYQSAYAEFAFPTVLWPDIKEQDLAALFLAFQKRERRFGGLRAKR